VSGSFEQCHFFINFGVIEELLELVEIHIKEAEQKKKGMNQFVVETSLNILSNITLQGFKKAESNNKNVFCGVFNSIKGVERMVKIFDFLFLHLNENGEERFLLCTKKNTRIISISICRLFKSDIPPSLCKNVVNFVKSKIESEKNESGTSVLSKSEEEEVWKEMINVNVN
jgi:hypothetical protein